MQLVALLMFCAVAAAAHSLEAQKGHQVQVASMVAPLDLSAAADFSGDSRSNQVDHLVNQAIAYLRRVINNGSELLGFPPLDPLDLDHFQLDLPAGIINMYLELQKVHVTGFGGFVVHTSKLEIRELTLDLDVTFPRIYAQAGLYDLVGDLFTAIPLFGKGECYFTIEDLRVKALLHLKKSENGQSLLIDRVENASFELPNFKVHLSGVIGGGDIDHIVNALIEDVVIDYVKRFHGIISIVNSRLAVAALNPILDQLDTWRYIERFV